MANSNRGSTPTDLEFVKNYLRVDYDHDDDFIRLLMNTAESYIQNRLGMSFNEMREVRGDIPEELVIPYLAIISHWYDRRELQTHRNTEKELDHVFDDVIGMFRNWNL